MPHDILDGQESEADEELDAQALAAENADLRDRVLRALAEAENTRRRAERTAADTRRYAISDFARELLTVADNLQRAIVTAERHAVDSPDDIALIEGVRATERSLLNTLERFGIRKIDARGEQFDPTLHEAVMQSEDGSQQPGTIVDVVEDGYKIHDRLLRPARVVVTANRGDAPARDSVQSGPGQHS
jgi:molecular chaperone GrpE